MVQLSRHQYILSAKSSFKRIHTVRLLQLIAFVLLIVLPVNSQVLFSLPPSILQKAENKYGQEARSRLLAWQKLIANSSIEKEQDKLNIVNNFFNRLTFVPDITHWKQIDYWATPLEFLASGGGDCEDFSIAKFFTLKALGVDEKKLNISYVKSITLNQAHMVVTYYPTPDAEPLILDNLISDILPARNRTDLIPIYSFNGSSLWLAKKRGKGKKLGKSDRLSKWQGLLSRMTQEFEQQ